MKTRMTERNQLLIKQAVSTFGTFNPIECFHIIEEELYVDEGGDILNFMAWAYEQEVKGFRAPTKKLWAMWKQAGCPATTTLEVEEPEVLVPVGAVNPTGLTQYAVTRKPSRYAT